VIAYWEDSNPGRDKRFFSSPKCPDWPWGLPSLLVIGHWGFSLGINYINQPGYNFDHLISM